MTQNDFQFICDEHGVLLEVALEHEFVLKVLKDDVSRPSLANQLKLSAYIRESI